MNVIRFFARNAPFSLLFAVAAAVISGFSGIALLALFTHMLKGAGRYSAFTMGSVLFALCLLLPLARFISQALLVRLGQGELFNLRLRLSRQILRAELRHLEILGSEPFMTAFTEDMPKIVAALNHIPRLCLNLAIALSGFLYLGWLSWRVLLLVLGFAVLGLLAYQLPSLWYFRFFRAARQELDVLFGHFKDMTEGIKELKMHSRRRAVFLSEVLPGTATSRITNLLKALHYHAIANSFGQTLVFVVIGLILFSSIAGASGTVGLAGIITVLYMTNALQSVMNMLPNLNIADVALQRLDALTRQLEIAGMPEPEKEMAMEAGEKCEDLTLKAITYAYPGGKENETFILGPINMTLNAGQLIVLTGGNGSGKTTLAKIITGLYPAENGELLLNGRKITNENREFYRRHFSAIFYDFHLFESLLGLEKPDLDNRARERLARLKLNHVVSIRNGTFSTTQLSQGQRKRLALLTASLEDRPIYVFDEWAADQDPEFKAFFYRRLAADLKASGKLVVIICHDDHYFDIADRMIKLESGKIIYDGAPLAS